MDLQLKGKGAVVTAASKGIGRAIALRLASEGVNVAICARGESSLRAAEAELRQTGVNVLARVCDVGDAAALEGFLGEARQALGRIDILVNNASGFGLSDDEAAWQASVNVDLLPAVRATRIVTPWMAAAGGGSIVHISSVAALEAFGSAAAYSAVKLALISHSNTMAVTLASQKIRVNAVAPGSIEFPGGMWEQVKQGNRPFYDAILGTIPWGRLGTPDEVADAVVFLSSPRASWITGVCLVVDGGQHKGNF
jgi:NAD(P)-dependent dehydrogenase (short-subunit alcohol dehydrogenase family)